VPSEFLPPDPYADAQPAPQPASRPVFLPPSATLPPSPAQRENKRATTGLALGAGGLGLLFFSAGALFFLTVPASVAGWILGHQAKQRESGRDQANLAVILGIVGVVFGVIAGVVWILLIALGDVSTSTTTDHGRDSGLSFDVIRLVCGLR
jgi:hypothetical protein